MRRDLLPYQNRWIADRAGFKVIEKSRRIGISWAEAYDAVLHAGGDRGNVYYQSYDRDMTRGFIDDCADWARVLEIGSRLAAEPLLAEMAGSVQVFKLALATGKEIRAMTSAPRAFRSKGRPGDRAVIDEAAFVDDLAAVLKAARAFRQWGGSVHVISTHNGAASVFSSLCRDLRDRLVPGSLHRVTFRDALADGLYRRICEIRRERWTPEGEAGWEAAIRREYGADAAEELDCVPAAGAGAWLAWELIRAAEDPAAGAPAGYRGGRCWIGVDIARRRDLWVAAVLEAVGDVLWLRELVTRRGITFSEQVGVVADLAGRYRPLRVAVDQTGMGEAVVERLRERHGRLRVEGVVMTAPRRLDLATALRAALEDRRLRLPPDEALRRDLHAVRAESGGAGAPRLVAVRAGTDGHADRFWALALACAAAEGRGPVAVRSVGGVHAALRGGAGHVIDRRSRVVRGPLAGVAPHG